jgi:TATA-box binding protein (TBP) (component of TFIID and TFIIIB)
MFPQTEYAILDAPQEQPIQKEFGKLKISTKTVMAYPNCSFILNERLANMFPLNEITPPNARKAKEIIDPKPGFYQVKSEWGCRGISPPGGKRAFRNQITILIYHNDRFCNIKIFPTGKFHMTGCNDKKSYTLAAIKLLNTIRSFHTEENPIIIQTEADIREGTYRQQEPLVITPQVVLTAPTEQSSSKLASKDIDDIAVNNKGPVNVLELQNKNTSKKAAKSSKSLKNSKKAPTAEVVPIDTISATDSMNKESTAEPLTLPPTESAPEIVPTQPLGTVFSMIFDVVMVNLDFNLGFRVDQIKLNDLLLDNIEKEGLYPVYESTTNTSVNIKMPYPDPVSKRFDKYYIDPDFNSESPIIQSVFTTECRKSKPKITRTHTFLVFSSSKVIQSGSFYDTEMKSAYYKFCKFVYENRSKVEVGLSNSVFDFSQLRGLNAILAQRSVSVTDRVTG